MFDGTTFERTYAYIFSARFTDGPILEVAVHPEACGDDVVEAEILSSTYSEVMGRIPFIFRNKITNLHLRPGIFKKSK